MSYRAVVAVLACVVLSGCGSDSDPAADSAADDTEVAASTTTTTTIAAAPDSLPPTDAPTTDAPATVPTTNSTTTTSTTTTSTTSPPTTVQGADDCLEGSWSLSPEGVTTLYSNLLPGFPLEVTGSHFVTFADNTVDFWTLLELRFLAGGTDVTFGMDQHGVGTYSVGADAVALFTYDTFEQRLHEGHGSAESNPSNDPAVHADEYVDLADNGDGTITINRITVPVPDLPPFAGGPIGCSGDQMSLGYTSGLADRVAVYVRVS